MTDCALTTKMMTVQMEPHSEDDDELDETVHFVPDSSFEDVFDDKDADQVGFICKQMTEFFGPRKFFLKYLKIGK